MWNLLSCNPWSTFCEVGYEKWNVWFKAKECRTEMVHIKCLTIKVTFISYSKKKNIRKQMGVIRAHTRIWTEFKTGNTSVATFFVIFYVTIWIMLTNMWENISYLYLLWRLMYVHSFVFSFLFIAFSFVSHKPFVLYPNKCGRVININVHNFFKVSSNKF